MICKVLSIALLVAYSQAAQYDNHQATSFIKLNDNHNSVHHIHSAPAVIKAAPVYQAAPVHVAPSHGYSAPHASHAYAAPHAQGHAQSYSSINLAAPAGHYAAPAGHYAAPAVVKVAVAPSHHASSYSGFSSSSIQHAAPAAHYAAPVAKHVVPVAYAHAPAHQQYSHHHEEVHAPAKYEFAYGVEDHHTGDIHSHKEARDGDVTHGEYSLHEADGTVRTVKYTVDKHSGFNAIVERSGHATHAQPAKAVYAAPVKVVSAPAAPHHYHH